MLPTTETGLSVLQQVVLNLVHKATARGGGGGGGGGEEGRREWMGRRREGGK